MSTRSKLVDQPQILLEKQPEIKYVGNYEPVYTTKGSAGFDLQTTEKVRVYPGELVKVDLGIKVQVPEGYYLQVVPRSSLAKSGLIMANSFGVIDSDYTGTVFAPLRNITKDKVILEKGQRIVQGILRKYEQVSFNNVKSLTKTKRGEGGYGSTGK